MPVTQPLNLSLFVSKPNQLSLFVGRHSVAHLESEIEREKCPYCQDATCMLTCSDSIPEPGEDADPDVFDRIKYNGCLDGIESALLSIVVAPHKRGLFDQIDKLSEVFEEALATSLDAAGNND